MARDKTDKTDETHCDNRDTCDTETPSRAEIEATLDRVVPGILGDIDGKDTVPGWHLLCAAKVEIIEVGAAKVPYLPEESGAQLVAMAEGNPHAFDLASYIAGTHVIVMRTTGIDLCSPLSVFAARVLKGEIARPPQPGRPRAATVLLRLWQYGLCRFVAATTPLRLTRNDEPGRERALEIFTACDAVAHAFTRAGKRATYANLKSLCYDEAHRDIRELAEYLGITEGLD